MAEVRSGWVVALSAVLLAASAWLPWLTTSVAGGGRANGIGGVVGSMAAADHFGPGQLIVLLASVVMVTGAMVARGVSPRLAAGVALMVSVLIAVVMWWYYRVNVTAPVTAGYGLFISAGCVVAMVMSSVWALSAAVRTGT